MRLKIDRTKCGHHPAACEQCFGDYLRNGRSPEHGCISTLEEDGRPEIYVTVRSGEFTGTFVVTDENRERVIYEGWMKFVHMPRESQPDGAEGEAGGKRGNSQG